MGWSDWVKGIVLNYAERLEGLGDIDPRGQLGEFFLGFWGSEGLEGEE